MLITHFNTLQNNLNEAKKITDHVETNSAEFKGNCLKVIDATIKTLEKQKIPMGRGLLDNVFNGNINSKIKRLKKTRSAVIKTKVSSGDAASKVGIVVMHAIDKASKEISNKKIKASIIDDKKTIEKKMTDLQNDFSSLRGKMLSCAKEIKSINSIKNKNRNILSKIQSHFNKIEVKNSVDIPTARRMIRKIESRHLKI